MTSQTRMTSRSGNSRRRSWWRSRGRKSATTSQSAPCPSPTRRSSNTSQVNSGHVVLVVYGALPRIGIGAFRGQEKIALQTIYCTRHGRLLTHPSSVAERFPQASMENRKVLLGHARLKAGPAVCSHVRIVVMEKPPPPYQEAPLVVGRTLCTGVGDVAHPFC